MLVDSDLRFDLHAFLIITIYFCFPSESSLVLFNCRTVNLVISAKCERSEHWRRLRDWPFCPCFCRSVYMMTHNSNDVIALTASSSNAGCYISLPPLQRSGSSFSLPFLVFKSLHLAEICTLMSAF